MIWFRIPVKYREWWDTRLSRLYGADGYAATLWVRHFFPYPHPAHANDETGDGLRW